MHNIKIIILALLFLLFSFSQAIASDPVNDPNDTTIHDQCQERSDGSTTSLRECAANEINRLDRILNKSYKKIMNSSLSKKDKEKIRTVQRNWLQYRDQMMEVVAMYVSEGTIGPLERAGAYTEILQTQTVLLWRLAESIE